ncbi:MAG: hypothetical protein K2Q45_07050, partial [Nitrosomonas sp.]|nr:hypothetical protein [Nitrosomonas sp.]
KKFSDSTVNLFFLLFFFKKNKIFCFSRTWRFFFMSDRVLTVDQQWYLCRDTLIGCNYVEQNVPKALTLAKECLHPDAVWLNAVVANALIFCPRDLIGVLSEEKYKEDARALCFKYLLDQTNDDCLLKAANLGYVFAKVLVIQNHYVFCRLVSISSNILNDLNITLKECCETGEREAFFIMGCWLNFKHHREADIYLEEAARLGHCEAMTFLIQKKDIYNPESWYWSALLAKVGIFSSIAKECLDEFKSNHFVVIFGFGKVAKIMLDLPITLDIYRIVGSVKNYETLSEAAAIYKKQLSCARKIVETWTLCAKRMGIYKDLRKLIGQFVWNDRNIISYLF